MKYKKFKLTENEYNHIKSELKREPNDFELHLFSATYSEHCSYKHSKELLKLLPRENAVFPFENAGGIKVGDHVILFKMESHNHPCAVEPFNGSATGIGGIIRDVLAMNARPIALCNSLKFGDKSKRVIDGVVKGISVYGNSIGVPNISTEVLFDDCYEQNPLVNVTTIGITKADRVLTSNMAYAGLKLMLVGSATMKDGMGGAAFASKKLSDEKKSDKLSIQIANPFAKKKLIEACLDIFSKKLVIACQDCGAAGILSSTSEVAYKSGCGVEINLDKIHLGDKSIKDFEIMLSETQERMLFVVDEQNISEIENILDKYELEHSIFGKVIKEKKYIVKNKGKIKADLPTVLLVNPPKVKIKFDNKKMKTQHKRTYSPTHLFTYSPIYEQYDHTVGARTQFQPYENPQFNALWIYEENCSLGVLTFSVVIKNNPFEEVYEAILTASKSLEEKSYKPIGITDCLNFANPEIPPTMHEFRQTILAIKKACEELNIPVCSGNVSFYNESNGSKIKNTPAFTMLGIKRL
ncbi:MAG TPA: phosphoribosylformylglycinamidine synthase subunit PurL [Candidatus Gastranaerophilaceae bacterium]|nr:phosphoribosylformylglycinamidine synthase subunit PurL [Candidatus Gastranaerophilaceae bacterium]